MPKLKDAVSFRGSTYRARKRRWLRFALGLLGLWAVLPILFGHRAVVINTSPSVAPGLYVRSAIKPAVGQIVDFCIPEHAKHYVQDRTGEACDDWYILKPIAAGPGDRVDTTGEWLVINGHKTAPMPPPKDSAGRPLPVWRQSRVLGADEFFVFSNRIANSFDSRCYGPIARNQIDSVRRPLMTW
jgi:conjugative transfer signal peptidase TraF